MALKKLSLYLSLSFHINFKQRKLSLLRICMTIERESERDKKRERAFLKAFSPKLQILKFNLKSTSDSKILKIWIWEAFLVDFQKKYKIHIFEGRQKALWKLIWTVPIFPQSKNDYCFTDTLIVHRSSSALLMNFNCSCYSHFHHFLFRRLMTILCRKTIQSEINNSSNLHFFFLFLFSRFFLPVFFPKETTYCNDTWIRLLVFIHCMKCHLSTLDGT